MTHAATLDHRIEDARILVLERTFAATPERVFAAFTQAEHLRHWWGPRGWELTHCTVDLTPGGRWHYCMTCTDPAQGDFHGMQSWGLGVYERIEAPTRLTYTDHFSDEHGAVNDQMPATLADLTFEAVPGGTRVTSRSTYVRPEDLQAVMDMGMLQGITETWDRLAEHLA